MCSSKPSAGTPSLETWARGLWPTPVATDAADAADAARGTTTTGVMHPGTTLVDAMRSWHSPTSRDWKGAGPVGKRARYGDLPMQALAFPSGRPDQETQPPGNESQPSGLTLSPRFVEWLMGFRPGWTETRTGRSPTDVPASGPSGTQ